MDERRFYHGCPTESLASHEQTPNTERSLEATYEDATPQRLDTAPAITACKPRPLVSFSKCSKYFQMEAKEIKRSVKEVESQKIEKERQLMEACQLIEQYQQVVDIEKSKVAELEQSNQYLSQNLEFTQQSLRELEVKTANLEQTEARDIERIQALEQ